MTFNSEIVASSKTGKRLLIAAFTAPPNQDGVAMAVGNMAEELAKRGWEIFIATTEVATLSEDTNIKSFYVPKGLNRRSYAFRKKNLLQLFEWIDRINPSLIVIHSWAGWPVASLMPYAKSRRLPIFVMGHGFGDHLMDWNWKPPFFGIASWVRSWCFVAKMIMWLPQMAGLVVLGKKPHYVRGFDHWLAKKIRYKRIHTIPNSVKPLNGTAMDFRNTHQLQGKLIYLLVAGFSTTKNQLLAVKAFSKANIPNSVLVMIGPDKNSYYDQVVSASKNSLKSSVLPLVGLTRAEVESAIKSCDVAILTSKSEMQPIFLLEAMSEGKPWICTDVGAVDELEGGIITSQSCSEIVSAISKLSSLACRLQLGAAAKKQWQQEFRSNNVYDKWDKLLLNN